MDVSDNLRLQTHERCCHTHLGGVVVDITCTDSALHVLKRCHYSLQILAFLVPYLKSDWVRCGKARIALTPLYARCNREIT